MASRRDYKKYEALLRVRERHERLKAQALADTRRAIRREEGRREEIFRDQKRVIEEAGAQAQRTFDPAAVHAYFQYERHLARLAVEKDAAVRALRTVETERRRELEEAVKRRRVVERLRERALQAYARAIRKHEQLFHDEVAAAQAARARKTERSA
jgi:flagellar FliJ protein